MFNDCNKPVKNKEVVFALLDPSCWEQHNVQLAMFFNKPIFKFLCFIRNYSEASVCRWTTSWQARRWTEFSTNGHGRVQACSRSLSHCLSPSKDSAIWGRDTQLTRYFFINQQTRDLLSLKCLRHNQFYMYIAWLLLKPILPLFGDNLTFRNKSTKFYTYTGIFTLRKRNQMYELRPSNNHTE